MSSHARQLTELRRFIRRELIAYALVTLFRECDSPAGAAHNGDATGGQHMAATTTKRKPAMPRAKPKTPRATAGRSTRAAAKPRSKR